MLWSLAVLPNLALAFSWASLFSGSQGVAADHADQYIIEAPSQPRVAIIGAGAAGSSAAFWISKAAERLGKDIVIDVFERSNYIGGSKSAVSNIARCPFSHEVINRKHSSLPIQ